MPPVRVSRLVTKRPVVRRAGRHQVGRLTDDQSFRDGSVDASGPAGSGVPGHFKTRVAAVARRFFPWVVVDLPLVWFSYALALLVRGVNRREGADHGD